MGFFTQSLYKAIKEGFQNNYTMKIERVSFKT